MPPLVFPIAKTFDVCVEDVFQYQGGSEES